jgi:acyl dehydratase
MSVASAVEEAKKMVGQEVGVSEWMVIDQERINKFAEATGDFQWIHVDIEKANAGPFGTPIAHGFLTLSLIPLFGAAIKMPVFAGLNVQMGINYGLNKVRFINPVPVGSKVRSRIVLTDVKEKGPGRILSTYTHNIEIEGEEKPACIAEQLGMMVVAEN